MTSTAELLVSVGVPRAEAARIATVPTLSGGPEMARDFEPLSPWLLESGELLHRLPPKPQRSVTEQAAAAALLADARQARERFAQRHAAAVYHRLTAGRTRLVRLRELAYAAAREFPGLVPTEAEVARERALLQMNQDGAQIDQGILLAHLFADRASGLHLLHAMAQPTEAALALLGQLRRTGRVQLVPMTLEREGTLGRITFHHQAWLNAEDDEYQQALETLVDLVLLDDQIRVGVLRGAPMEKAKYLGRRVFGSGINLTLLYRGQISLVDFMLTRETGPLDKIYRGLARPEYTGSEIEDRVEKPFIAAVDGFAIGGHCQMLLILDRVIAERGSYFNLPARKEGIIPGLANLRLPRFVGERATRQGIFFNRSFAAESPEGALLCDEVLPGEQLDAAVTASALELTGAGPTSLVANRRALRVGAEPLDLFRSYLATYAREQAFCLYSPALIDNLVRNWNADRRR